jgi:hypothetical protein
MYLIAALVAASRPLRQEVELWPERIARALKFRGRPHDVKDVLAAGRAGVDAVGEALESDAAPFEIDEDAD